MTTTVASRSIITEVRQAVGEVRELLLDLQRPEGCWEARIESDPSVTAQYLLLARYLGRLDAHVEEEMLEYVRHSQLADGGWAAYPGGTASLDVSLLCYAALRFGGWPPDGPDLARAKRVILEQGGLEAVGFTARVLLAFLGQAPLDGLIYLSPKMILLPGVVHPNLRDLGAIGPGVLSLELLLKRRAVQRPPAGRDLNELRRGVPFPRARMHPVGTLISLASRWIDRVAPAPSLDRRAVDWLVARRNADGLWMGMLPFTMRSLMVLRSVDGAGHASLIEDGMRALTALQVRDGRGLWQQLGRSPVLDTAVVVSTLIYSGVRADDPRLRKAFDWLLAQQARRVGDWRYQARYTEPGGWSFSPANDRNPDTDTTLHVLETLALAPPDLPGRDEALARGLGWLLAMQNDDGSWGMWGRHAPAGRAIVRELELNDALDAGTADVTARAVRAVSRVATIAAFAGARAQSAIEQGVGFLRSAQRADGSWPGKWAVNFTYGTTQGIMALVAAGRQSDPATRRAVAWLRSVQQPDGGWGESPESHAADRYIAAPSTVMQTGLALLALMVADESADPDLLRGLGFLLDRRSDGALWSEATFCQTLLRDHWYCQNTLFPTCLAQIAIVLLLRGAGGSSGGEA
jgi:squalene-hopene/tetraprenyl-beta-curcumene cyclase